MNNKLISSLLIASALMISGPASSATVGLDSLLGGGSVTVGDLLFDNFTFTRSGFGTPGDASGINVTSLLPPPSAGIEFQSGFFATVNKWEDFLIQFDVTALNPNHKLHDVGLYFNGSVTGDGFTSITETVTNKDSTSGHIGDVLAQIFTHTPPPNQVLTDYAVLAFNTGKMHVKKDIYLNGGEYGTASISVIEQRYSQTVPEPMTLMLMGIGLVAFEVRRRFA